MAFNSTAIWEVQTTGSDTNGGAFDPAIGTTDYSYGVSQTTISYTDILVNATTTKISSVLRPFIAADVGNFINAIAGTGFTGQRLEILSVSGGVATVDKSAGTSAAVGSGTLGGALASPGLACGLMVAGNTIYIKGGPFTITSASSNVSGGVLITPAGSGTNPIQIVGYTSARGDNGMATIIAGGSISSVTIIIPGAAAYFYNLVIDGNSQSAITGISNGSAYWYGFNVRFKNLTTDSAVANGSGICIGCEFTNSIAPRSINFVSCVSHGNISTAGGFSINNGNFAIDCIAYNNPGTLAVGFSVASGGHVENCTSYNNGGPGFSFGNGIIYFPAINCVATGNATYGFTALTATKIALVNCFTYNNTTSAYSNITPTIGGSYPTALSGDPFVSASTGNFALNSTSGAGLALQGAGFPSTFPAGLTASYPDVGAAQHSGGGSTYIYPIFD